MMSIPQIDAVGIVLGMLGLAATLAARRGCNADPFLMAVALGTPLILWSWPL